MGHGKKILKNIDYVLREETPENIDEFAQHLRENIEASANNLRRNSILVISLFLAHFLISNGFIEEFDLGPTSLTDSHSFRITLLWLGCAAILLASINEYGWRCYRETYDWLYVSSDSAFTKTGLHDLRIPATTLQYIDLLRDDGTRSGKWLARVLRLFLLTFFRFIPTFYFISELYYSLPYNGENCVMNIILFIVAIFGSVLIFLSCCVSIKSTNLALRV